MSSVHFVCVGEDVERAEALADVFDEAGLSVAGDDAMMDDDDVAVLVWSEDSARSGGFMNTAQSLMDEGRAVIASFVAIADASSIGAPVFDLSDWNLKSRNEPALVPLIYAAERIMPAGSEVAAVDVEDAAFEDVAEPAPLELSEPLVEAAEEAVAEPEPLVAAEIAAATQDSPAIAQPPRRAAKVKAARREKPKREKARAPRRAYVPPPPGRLRAALPFLGAITACIAAVLVVTPMLAGGARAPIEAAHTADVDVLRLAPIARVQEITPRPFAELAVLETPRLIRLAPAPRVRAERGLLQLASATEAPRPRRARTPRNVTSWDTPDPKLRSYMQATGVETPPPTPPAPARASLKDKPEGA